MNSYDNNTWTVMAIIFIVLTLGLGVGEYFTAKALQQANSDCKTRQEAFNNAEKENQALSFRCAQLKELIGYSPDMKTEDLIKDLDERLAGLEGNYNSCDETIVALIGMIAQRNDEVQQAKTERDGHYATAGEEEERAKQQKADFDNEIDTITSENKDSLQKAAQEYDTLSGETVDEVRNVEQAKRTAAVNRKHVKAQTVSAEQSVKVIAGINAGLRDKIEQLTDPFFQEPDGKVVYVDQFDRVVRLNIGKAQGVRLLTKFAVFSSGAVERGEIKPKGAVEVIRFVNDNESDARIIEDEETLRKVINSVDREGVAAKVLEYELTAPISQGDLVFTPLWQRGERVTYALDYFLDIDNDGQDDLDLLVNIIHANGGHIDAWIDKNGEIRGAITPETTYLIVSNTLIDTALDASDLSDEAKTAIKDAHINLFADAEVKGLRQMKLNEFLRRSHFRQTSEISRFRGRGELDVKPDTTRIPVIPNLGTTSIYNLNPEETKIDPQSPQTEAAADTTAETPPTEGSPPAFRRRTPKDP